MRNITPRSALLAATIVAGALATTPAMAQGFDRSDGRQPGGGSYYDRQQDRFGGGASDYYGRENYERGYRMGREDERRGGAMRGGTQSGFGQQGMHGGSGWPGGWGGQTASAGDDQGLLILLIERDRQQQAMRDIRQSLQQARTALQQGDQAQARTAIDQADQTLRQANALQNQQQIERSLSQAEQALQRGDRQAVQQALQQARQAIRSSGEPQDGRAGQQQQPAQQQSGAATGAQGQEGAPASGGGGQRAATGGTGSQPGR